MADTKAACDALKPNFTVLADFTGLSLFGLPDFTEKVQTTLMDAGVKKIASVWNKETFAKLVVDSSAQKVAGEHTTRRGECFTVRLRPRRGSTNDALLAFRLLY